MVPQLHEGEYVFCTTKYADEIEISKVIGLFKEAEGYTVILQRELADELKLSYNYIAAWITLTVHSSLQAVGLTAAFSTALAENGISCNVVAGFYHDHIFVDTNNAVKAMTVLNKLSNEAG
jgi:uncharacterized protein